MTASQTTGFFRSIFATLAVPARWTSAAAALALVLVSAWLLRVAVPPHGIAPAAWIALVPLVLAVRDRGAGRAALLGFAFGVASLATMHTWFFRLPGANVFNASALFGYLSLYPAIWCATLALLMRRRLPWIFPGAVLWVVLEWLRSNAGFLAIPWDPLSHSQVADPPFLQLAAFGGAPAIAFVVCLVNLALARAAAERDLRPLSIPMAVVLAIHVLGYARLQSAQTGEAFKVALIQPANDGARQAERFRVLAQLTRDAAGAKPDLIVWPESAVPGFALRPSVVEAVAGIARDARAPILFGSADYGKYAKAAGDRAGEIEFKNEAFLMLPDGTVRGPAIKNRLVPFAEYMPLEQYFRWPRWLVERQLHGIAGSDPEMLVLGRDAQVGVSICWESLFTGLARRLVARGASAIVQLSNDSDFGVSGEPAQHAAASVLRAVEYARPVVLASSSGPSMLIDTRGSTIDDLELIGISGWTARTVSFAGSTTVYDHVGAWWIVVLALGAMLTIIRKSTIHRRGA